MKWRRSIVFLTSAVLGAGLVSGCMNNAELKRLEEENARLRERLAQASENQGVNEITLMPVREVTVGLAAAERGFDEGAFLRLLKESLQGASVGDARFSVAVENNERQIAKVRGMLVQQYLGSQKVPIRITNVTYVLRSEEDDFKVGGELIPPGRVDKQETSDGLVRCSFKGPLVAQMQRDSQGRYSIPYEDTSGRSGSIPVLIRDVEIFDPDQEPQAARQGEVSLNWQLSLEKIQVYQVTGFAGDMGRFMHRMRYPDMQTSINQYQTINDSVLLFGYGPYTTGLLNQLTTPSYISDVEVLAISPALYQQLETGLTENRLSEVLASSGTNWARCEYVGFQEDQKVWKRPASIGFPFVSRQTSNDKDLVFYTKYNANEQRLIGDFPAGGE